MVGPVNAASTQTLVAQAPQQLPQQQALITGTVRDSRGVAQGDAVIAITGPAGSQTLKTDPNGHFSVSVSPGIYSISINKGGFQTLTADDVVVATQSVNNAVYTLADATSSTTREIGRTSTRSGPTPLNRGVTAQSTITADEIGSFASANLDYQITDLPGVSLIQGNRSTLAYFNIRGSVNGIETRTEIDGHPLSTGVSGVYYTGLLNPGIFEAVDIEKGPGVFAADAGEQSFGTINLRTWDFTDTTNGFLKQGIDSYNGQFTSALIRGSLLPKDRISYVLDYNVTGYNGPGFGYYGPLAAPSGNTITPAYTIGTSNVGSALVDYIGTFNAGERLASEVFKLRYRFSDTTSLWAGFVGSQGFVNPEGSQYGYAYGQYTVVPCFTAGKPEASLAGCNQSSVYSNPLAAPYYGTTIPLYSAYPDETQTENNPMFEAEFRTSFKDDTILIRPFTQVVQRINDGTQAPNTPGNNGAFSLATLPSQCSATNPCYIANGGALTTYTSATNPCAASNTPVATSCYQDGAADPYYQYELDRLHGVTGTYLHPLGSLGTFQFAYQYTSDYTYDISGNAPTPAAPIALAGFPTFPQSISDASNLSVPGAVRRANDFSATVFLSPTSKFSVAAALFYDLDSLDFSYENPAILALAPYTPGGSANLPLDLLDGNINREHFDPHAGFVYNANKNVAIRLVGGSSVTLPYAQQVSGLPTFSQPSTTYPYGYYTEKNPYLTPETIVAYNIGADVRIPDGGVFTFDAYDNTIHNAFLTEYTVIPNSTLPATKSTVNASTYKSYGAEFAFKNDPVIGFGYNAQLSLNRAYYYNLGAAFYGSNTGYLTTFDNRQLDGNPYAVASLSLVYKGSHNTRAEFGGTYNGNNNSYFVPGFLTFNAVFRRDIAKHVSVLLSGRNIFNFQDLANVAKATPYGTGISTVECKYAKSATDPTEYVQSACESYTNGQQQIEPQQFSAALQIHL